MGRPRTRFPVEGGQPRWGRAGFPAKWGPAAGAGSASTGWQRRPGAAAEVPRVAGGSGAPCSDFHGWKSCAGGAGHDFHGPGAGQSVMQCAAPPDRAGALDSLVRHAVRRWVI